MTFSINSPIIQLFGRCSLPFFYKRGIRFIGSTPVLDGSEAQASLTTLSEQLRSRIQVRGPITVADYMRAVLTSPSGGYYMHKDVLGRQGDFTTSPEITQLFGDMVGIWFVNEVNKFSNSSQPVQLVELGPGRGTLTADVLNVFKNLRGKDGLSVHLIEISPEFSRIQAEKLCESSSVESCFQSASQTQTENKAGGRRYQIDRSLDNTKGKSFGTVTVGRPRNLPKKGDAKHYQKGVMKDGTPVFWYYSLNEVPHNFSCFLAHEFFDALPVHKFKKTPEGWRELLISNDPEKGPDHFKFLLSRSGTPASKVFMKPWDERKEAEICPDAGLIGQQIAARLEKSGGTALIIDYGHEGDSNDTFRAFKNHKQVDPLVSPGSADLTADVDFAYLRNSFSEKTLTFGPVSQSHFLKKMGVDLRLQILLDEYPEDQKPHLQSGYDMIMNSMGERFKFFAAFPYVLKDHLKKYPVAGFS